MTFDLKIIDGEKATRLEDLPPEAWRSLTGGTVDGDMLEKLYSSVPWLWRGVRARASAMSKMPFTISQGENVIDDSKDYQNAVGFWPNPPATLALLESSLALVNRAYLFKERDGLFGKIRLLRYLVFTTVEPKLDRRKGLIGFERRIGGEPIPLREEDLVWFWGIDPFTEIGPSPKSPAKAAIRAAGVLFNVDTFVESFFARGAIKASIIAVPTATSRGERDRLANWFRRAVNGIKNSWGTNVIADKITIQQIGEGIAELANTDLTKEKRQDIAVAMGVPQNILFSDEANFATAKQEDFRLYDQTINPQAEFIEHVLNELLFNELGLTLKFRPQTLEVFQEEEVQKSEALVNYERSGIPSWLGVEILGIDLPPDVTQDDLQKEIVTYLEFKSELRIPSSESANGDPFMSGHKDKRSIIDEWENHALKRLKNGKKIKGTKNAPAFDHNGELSKAMEKAIGGALQNADTPEKIKRVFATIKKNSQKSTHIHTWEDYP